MVQDIVNAICDDDNIRAISFVGSNTVCTIPILFLNSEYMKLLLSMIYVRLVQLKNVLSVSIYYVAALSRIHKRFCAKN